MSKLLANSDDLRYAYRLGKGLNGEVVKKISEEKKEPKWMLKRRLEALKVYKGLGMPDWGADLSEIDFKNIHYYLKPLGGQKKSWDEVPKNVKDTFEKIGVPQAERKFLSGAKAQLDSQVIYGSLKKALSKKGVVFLSMDEGLLKYPELVKEYFGSVVPLGDNKLAALNSAVWSGGSFIYVPKGVDVGLPLQAYFRINSERAGQFERTLIIADEGSKLHYVEGCFTGGANVLTKEGPKLIKEVTKKDSVLTHKGRFKRVNYLQKRKFSGKMYKISYYGDPSQKLEVTEEHPFLFVKRSNLRDRNKRWKREWGKPGDLSKGDYLVVPVERKKLVRDVMCFKIKKWRNKKKIFEVVNIRVPCTPDFFRLIGYYLAEGSISNGFYLNFSFGSHEIEYLRDVKKLMKKVFGVGVSYESKHKTNNGTSLVYSSVELCRIFANFGRGNSNKCVPDWVIYEDSKKQKELIKGWFRGDGNYYKRRHNSGMKEVFRINTTSEKLVRQLQRILARLGVVAFINARDRAKENRKTMYTLGVSGEWMIGFGEIVGIKVKEKVNNKRRASMFGHDGRYVYLPIRKITCKDVEDVEVFNLGVDDDESYVAGGVAVHNCSAPSYSAGSLHAAVVEIVVKRRARVTYTTVQNWYKNVYNLVTKRALVGEEGEMRWIDGNLGSRVTMKYPACILAGRKAKGEMLSIAWAGKGQHQDTGAKMIHLAAETTSQIISKSVSKDGGRSSYRGLVHIARGAVGSKSKVVCDALILDDKSRSDTYPTNKIFENRVSLEHEATVSKMEEEKLFYLMSRGIKIEEAEAMIVNGFLEPIMKQIPLEYAIEMNKLVEMEMEGSVG